MSSDKPAAGAPTQTLGAERLARFLRRVRLDPTSDGEPVQGLDAGQALERLRRLTQAMSSSVAFEQLDVALGRGVVVGVDEAFEKIVAHDRGGYCFENNKLMGAVLAELGFAVQRRIARVILGGRVSGFSHMVNVVTLVDGSRFLVDVGFGGNSLREPLSLDTYGGVGAGRAQRMGPDIFRFADDCAEFECPGGMRLQCWDALYWHENGRPSEPGPALEACWKDQYVFHLERPVHDIDIELGNWWVSAKPEPVNWFTNLRLATALTPGGRKMLIRNTLVRADRVHEADLSAALGLGQCVAEQGVDASGPPVERVETTLDSLQESLRVLKAEFGIDLAWDHRTGRDVVVEDESFLPGAR